MQMSKNFILPGVVNCSEAPMSNFPEVIKDFVWIIAFEELRHIGVLEAPGPEKKLTKLVTDTYGCHSSWKSSINMKLRP